MNAAESERNQIFANFKADQNDSLDTFRRELCGHLSATLIVKESRTRYQKEQCDRLIASLGEANLLNKKMTLDQWCVEYSVMVQDLIERSNNYKCPKILANYNKQSENTIRPINATIFYFFFSANKVQRMLAQMLLDSAR